MCLIKTKDKSKKAKVKICSLSEILPFILTLNFCYCKTT